MEENLNPMEQQVEEAEDLRVQTDETAVLEQEETAVQKADVSAPVVDFWSADAPDYEPEPVFNMPTRPIYKKWWFWVIIAAVVFAALAVGIVLSDGSTGGSGSSGGGYSYSAPSISPYVTTVKTAKNSKYGITYGAAFDRFFASPKWSYFKASTGEHVVEFTGIFSYSGERATAKIQFIVDTREGTLEVYHLSINGVAQSRLVLATLVQKVFESYR